MELRTLSCLIISVIETKTKFYKNFLFLLFFLATSLINGQNNINAFSEEVEYPDCASCNSIKSNFLTSNNSDEYQMIEDLLSTIGADRIFTLVECKGASNAYATEIDGENYILYNKDFFESIRDGKGNYSWTSVSILAHEIGHHINNHNLDCDAVISNEKKREMELQADRFMGTAMRRLNATLEQAQMAINTLIPFEKNDSGSTHPSKSKRLNAIKEGWGDKGLEKYMSNLAEANLYKGIDYYKKGAYLEANQYLSAVIIFGFENDLVYKYLAKVNYDNGNYQDALIYIEKALSYNKNSSELYLQSALIKKELDPYGDETALSDLDKAIDLNPKDPRLYIERAIQGVYAGGGADRENTFFWQIEDFEKAAELDPNYFDAYYEKGKYLFLAYEYLGSSLWTEGLSLHDKEGWSPVEFFNVGIEALSKAISLNIEDRIKRLITDPETDSKSSDKLADAYITRAIFYQWINNYEEGLINNDIIISDFIKAIEVDELNIYAYNELARIKWREEKLEDAERYFLKYFEIIKDEFFDTPELTASGDPAIIEDPSWAEVGMIYNREEDWNGMTDQFVFNCLLLSDIYYKDKKIDKALEILDRGISIEPQSAENLFYLRGIIKSGQNDNYDALSDFKQVYDLISSANKSELLNYYAERLADKGLEGIISSYGFINTLGGSVGKSGIIKKEMKDYKGALNDLKEAIKIDPRLGISTDGIDVENESTKSFWLELADIYSKIFLDYQEAIKSINSGIDFLSSNKDLSISEEQINSFLYMAYYKLAENHHLYIEDKMEKRLLSEEIGEEESYDKPLNFIDKSIKILEKNLSNPDFIGTKKDLGQSYFLKSKIYFSQFKATDNWDYINLSHENINKAVSFVDDDPDIYFHRYRTGIISSDGDDSLEAMLDLQSSFEADKTNTRALFQLAQMQEIDEKYDSALKYYDKAVSIEKTSKNYYHRGRLKYKMEDYEGALKDYEIAEKIDKEEESKKQWRDGEKAWLYEDKALALIGLEKYHEAIYNYYLSIDFIQEYIDNGNERMYRELVYPNISSLSAMRLLYHEMGKIKFLLNNYGEAANDLKIAIKSFPKNSVVNYNLGLCLLKIGLEEEGCFYINKSFDLGSNESVFEYFETQNDFIPCDYN